MAMQLSTGQCAALACLLEATAPKPGNVHRGADFEDLTYVDFAASAVMIAPAMDQAAGQSVGRTVLAAVHATQQVSRTNSNLGMILLLAPLAKVDRATLLADGLANVLGRMDADDSLRVYEAIRLARPGGLGRVQEHDLVDAPPVHLLDAMRQAADRDLVARQYVNNFQEVLDFVAPELAARLSAGWRLSEAIVYTYLRLMSEYPDSLIARKCGEAVARQAADRAADVLRQGGPGDEAYQQALAGLDFWLRSDRHRRNPGTSADLIAAGLFVLLREGALTMPWVW